MSASVYWSYIWSCPEREAMALECPALMALTFQQLMGMMCRSRGTNLNDPPVLDPLRDSAVVSDIFQSMLRFTCPSQLLAQLFSPTASEPWRRMAEAVEQLWGLKGEGTAAAGWQHRIGTDLCFSFPGGAAPPPLTAVSQTNVIRAGESALQTATKAALSASVDASVSKGLCSALAVAGIVANMPTEGITAAALNFCMMAQPQQWWTLMDAAIQRIFRITSNDPIPELKRRIWQQIAILSVLDMNFMYAFPSKTQNLCGYHLLARLSEVGLVYPLKGPAGEMCFAISPYLRHAVQWESPATLCEASVLYSELSHSDRAISGKLSLDDADTIITETNYRLFVYSMNASLLRIVESFAVKEEVVNQVLVCFRISRDSFVTALQRGLTASQVFHFLSSKAHPSMRRRYTHDGFCLPQSFMDQLMMWESEHHRVVFVPNVVLLSNMSPAQKDGVLTLLKDYGESDALLVDDIGSVAIKEDVYQRLLARYFT